MRYHLHPFHASRGTRSSDGFTRYGALDCLRGCDHVSAQPVEAEVNLSRRLRHWFNDHEQGRKRFGDVLLVLAAFAVVFLAVALLLDRARA